MKVMKQVNAHLLCGIRGSLCNWPVTCDMIKPVPPNFIRHKWKCGGASLTVTLTLQTGHFCFHCAQDLDFGTNYWVLGALVCPVWNESPASLPGLFKVGWDDTGTVSGTGRSAPWESPSVSSPSRKWLSRGSWGPSCCQHEHLAAVVPDSARCWTA